MTLRESPSKLLVMYHGDLKAGSHVLEFGGVTYIAGVINLSPESRNAHTIASGPSEAVALARRYRQWGADLIEVGGQSSHYEAATLPPEQEAERLIPVVTALVEEGMPVAVDTWKPEVAEAVVEAGADIVNDTGGLSDERMRSLLAGSSAAVVVVHVDGSNPHDVDEVQLGEDKAELTAAALARLLGELPAELEARTILDPGIAINYRGDYAAYTRLQLDVIRKSDVLASLERPVMIPIPRKPDIHWVTAYITMALEYGADLIRVHDVPLAAGIRRLWDRVPR